MTKLEEKLKDLKFDKIKEQNGDIVYVKDILVLELNSTNTKIKKIHTTRSERWYLLELADTLITLANDLKELKEYDNRRS